MSALPIYLSDSREMRHLLNPENRPEAMHLVRVILVILRSHLADLFYCICWIWMYYVCSMLYLAEISGPIILDTYRVIDDFTKTSKNELNLHTGDLVEIVEKNQNGEFRVNNRIL